jgi:hypothetical protein
MADYTPHSMRMKNIYYYSEWCILGTTTIRVCLTVWQYDLILSLIDMSQYTRPQPRPAAVRQGGHQRSTTAGNGEMVKYYFLGPTTAPLHVLYRITTHLRVGSLTTNSQVSAIAWPNIWGRHPAPCHSPRAWPVSVAYTTCSVSGRRLYSIPQAPISTTEYSTRSSRKSWRPRSRKSSWSASDL